MLGQSKYFLVTGGWRGVDKFVAEKYSEQIIGTHNESLSKYLTQVVIKGNTPGFIGGNVYQIEPGIMEWIKCLNLVDLVILIGGMNRSDNSRGGTYQTYKFALQERVPVLPIRGSKQDCEEIFEELIKSWDPKLYSHFDRREFIKELGHPIENRTDAIIVVEGLKHIMNNYVIKRRS